VGTSNTITSASGVTYTIPAAATGQIYITNGITNGTGGGGSGQWNSGSAGTSTTGTLFTNSYGKQVMKIPPEKDPALEVTGKITWNGEDLNNRLERIETLLNIPTRDVIMEEKYKKLKELWEQYNKALAEYKTWETLKESK
jgi:hypothetical protein